MSGALSPNQIPSRFTHSPALIRIRGVRFAFLVRWKPEDAIVRFQGARPETIRAFHELDATLQKTLRLDRNDARKGAFGCFCRFHLISDKIAGRRTLNPCVAACAQAWLGDALESEAPFAD